MPQSSGPRTGGITLLQGGTEVIPVTLSLDTSIYADDDVLAAPQEVTGFFAAKGGCAILQSIVLIDEDDQNVDIDVLFLDASGSIGNENAAFSPADAVARTIIGRVSFSAASDYMDCINSRHGQKTGIGLPLKAADDSTSIWVAAVVRSGTPTFTASGIRLMLGVFREPA